MVCKRNRANYRVDGDIENMENGGERCNIYIRKI